jgi:hypothetical protein
MFSISSTEGNYKAARVEVAVEVEEGRVRVSKVYRQNI